MIQMCEEETGIEIQNVNGRRQVTAYGLYRISKALGVPMEELMEGVEDE